MLGGLGGGLVLGSVIGVAGTTWLADDPAPDRATPRPSGGPIHLTGAHQPGIDVPATPQTHGLLLVGDLDFLDDTDDAGSANADLGKLLATLSKAIYDLGEDLAISPAGPSDLTVTVGLGPRTVRAISPQLPGADELPPFAGDSHIDERARGGDLLLAIHASDPGVTGRAAIRLSASLPQLRPRWQQRGFRGPGTGTVTRNPLGHLDGVIVPRGEREMDENVWIPDGPAAGGTICVVRRLRLDQPGFTALSQDEQERTIGRRRGNGAPLSGGAPGDQVDLTAKTPDGEYMVPARSHARAAHPSFTGSALMLRRGYAFDNGPVDPDRIRSGDDAGLLFICFQRDLNTFVATQRRLDEQDDLMSYVTPTASASFLILPGYTADKPLGSGVLGAAS